jgi:hypothetical protein
MLKKKSMSWLQYYLLGHYGNVEKNQPAVFGMMAH